MLIKFNSFDRAEKTVGSTGTIQENLFRQVKEERDNTIQTHTHTHRRIKPHTYTHAHDVCYSSQSYLNIFPLKKKNYWLHVHSNTLERTFFFLFF